MQSLCIPDMQSQPRLFTLPRELRDTVYEFYFTDEAGYLYNYDTGKITKLKKEPVDFSLAYTCTLAAVELHGLALTYNTVHFTTAYDDDLRNRAGYSGDLLNLIRSIKCELLGATHACIDASVTLQVAQDQPRFLPAQHASQA
jgi:hypothetical protein